LTAYISLLNLSKGGQFINNLHNMETNERFTKLASRLPFDKDIHVRAWLIFRFYDLWQTFAVCVVVAGVDIVTLTTI
jgi:hypothetical protein